MNNSSAWHQLRDRIRKSATLTEELQPLRNRIETGFSKLNSARVLALREKSKALKTRVQNRLNIPSAADKIDELLSFERGL